MTQQVSSGNTYSDKKSPTTSKMWYFGNNLWWISDINSPSLPALNIIIKTITCVAACCVVVLIVLLTFFTAPTVLFRNTEFSNSLAPIFLPPPLFANIVEEPCFVHGHRSISWFVAPIFKKHIDLILYMVWWKYIWPTGVLSFIIINRGSYIFVCSTFPIMPSVIPRHSISSISERSHA